MREFVLAIAGAVLIVIANVSVGHALFKVDCGPPTLVGTPGDDVLIGTPGDDVIVGNWGMTSSRAVVGTTALLATMVTTASKVVTETM
jgi:hypothetical protein